VPIETLVMSPHYDDAVLSCGHWLERHPGAVVATVCCASPGVGVPAGGWDRRCGFARADEAAARRGAEDLAALEILGATQRRLPFCDEQYSAYRQATFEADIVAAVGALLDELQPQRCLFPVGVRHGDHQLTRRAARAALQKTAWCQAIAYADLPYSINSSRDLRKALAQSGLADADGERFEEVAQPSRKGKAFECYSSQLEQLGIDHPRWWESLVPGAERYWLIG
jgi:LmbE family N-acetylglucosaminyl deacetylase